MIGMLASVAPAMIRPKSVLASPCILAMPREIVSLRWELSMISCRK